MRYASALVSLVGLMFVPTAHAQSLLKATVQHARVEATSSGSSAAPGGALTLFVDVTPNPAIHIYADGAKDVTPVALVVTPNAAATVGKPKFPKAEIVTDPASLAPVPAYAHAFRIAVPVTIKATVRAGEVVTLGGVVNYQACDDHLCYPVSSAPVTWRISVR